MYIYMYIIYVCVCARFTCLVYSLHLLLQAHAKARGVTISCELADSIKALLSLY